MFVKLANQKKPLLTQCGITGSPKTTGLSVWIVAALSVKARIARLVQCAGMRLAMDRTVQRISRH